jgi:hypothetical protein
MKGELVTGVGLNEMGTPVLELRAVNGDKSQVLVPAAIAWQIGIDRHCIGYRPPLGKTLHPCQDNARGLPGSQCPVCADLASLLPCLRCQGDRCRNPARRPDCVQVDNHAIYLAAFAPGIHKVGVARWHRREARLREQGAYVGLIIGQTDGLLARRMETIISKFGNIVDRLSVRDHLRAATVESDPQALLAELRLKAASLQRRLIQQPWVEEMEQYTFPERQTLSHLPQLWSPSGASTLVGDVQGFIGQTMILQPEGGSLLAVDLPTLIGWHVQTVNKEQADYQLTLI